MKMWQLSDKWQFEVKIVTYLSTYIPTYHQSHFHLSLIHLASEVKKSAHPCHKPPRDGRVFNHGNGHHHIMATKKWRAVGEVWIYFLAVGVVQRRRCTYQLPRDEGEGESVCASSFSSSHHNHLIIFAVVISPSRSTNNHGSADTNNNINVLFRRRRHLSVDIVHQPRHLAHAEHPNHEAQLQRMHQLPAGLRYPKRQIHPPIPLHPPPPLQGGVAASTHACRRGTWKDKKKRWVCWNIVIILYSSLWFNSHCAMSIIVCATDKALGAVKKVLIEYGREGGEARAAGEK